MTVTPYLAEYSAYADINGDGIVDLITSPLFTNDKTPEVRLGNGRGGFGCDPVSDIACQITGQDWLGSAYKLFTPGVIAPWPLKMDFPYGVYD